MLRFLSERRAWVVAVGLVPGFAVASWLLGSRYVSARAVAMAHDRLGLEARIEETAVGLRGIELEGIRLRDPSGGVVVEVDRVSARVTPWGALFSGAMGVTGLTASEVDVALDLARPGVTDTIAMVKEALARRRSEPSSTSTSTAGRKYEVTSLDVRVRDEYGALVRMTDVDLSKERDDLAGSIAAGFVGDERGDHARIGPTTVALHRAEGSWAVGALSVDGADIRWIGDAPGDAEPLALRLRAALRVLRSSAPRDLDGPEDEATESSSPSPERRLSALRRLTDDVDIQLSEIDIQSRTPAGHLEEIHDLGVRLQGLEDGWIRLSGHGQTSNDGTLSVDLQAQPNEARIEGDLIAKDISLALIAPFVPEIPLHQPEKGLLTAAIELRASSPDQVRMKGRLRLREASLWSERIAEEPIEDINVDVAGEGMWYPLHRRLHVASAQIRLGDARALLEGDMERGAEHYRVDLTLRLPPTDCNDVVGAIPDDVLGSLGGFAWSGNWSALAHIVLDSRDLEATDLSIRVRDLCEFERIPRWVRTERFQQPFRHSVVEPDETIFEMVTGPESDNWVPLEDVSPFLIEAVLSHEDARFYDHGGFAPWAIRDALVRNLQEGRYVVGASTISMQLAKNLYLKREKTLARKVQEVILTWWLENALSKDEILELYLNVIEYGPGIYGLENAANHYFGRSPSTLSPAESVFLACILPSPKRYYAYYERDSLTKSMRTRMARLLEHMARRERIGAEALAYGLAELEQFDFHQRGEPTPLPRALPPLTEDRLEELDPFEALFVSP